MTNPNYTHLVLILDRSGSMQSIKKDMDGGINSLLIDQARNQTKDKKIFVDVVTFDTVVEFPLSNVFPADVPYDLIHPRGGTALLDALGLTIVKFGEKLDSLREDERPGKVIIVVVTDGQENSSREYTNEQIKALVTKQQEEFNWDFMYLGANQDSFAVAGNLGFARGSTINYAADAAGTQSVLRSASAYIATAAAGGEAAFSEEDRNAAL